MPDRAHCGAIQFPVSCCTKESAEPLGLFAGALNGCQMRVLYFHLIVVVQAGINAREQGNSLGYKEEEMGRIAPLLGAENTG